MMKLHITVLFIQDMGVDIYGTASHFSSECSENQIKSDVPQRSTKDFQCSRLFYDVCPMVNTLSFGG